MYKIETSFSICIVLLYNNIFGVSGDFSNNIYVVARQKESVVKFDSTKILHNCFGQILYKIVY